MRWAPGGDDSDVEDRRGSSGGGFQLGGAHIGCGGAIILLVLSLVFHKNFFALLSTNDVPTASGPSVARPVQESAGEHKEKEFVTFVLNDTQSTWQTILSQQGRASYRHAKLVLFRDSTDSGCGYAQSASGPFYCPEDEKVYIDLSFYDELQQRFGASGDFAQAYVIAHEIGHHVQKILGIEGKVHHLMENNPRRAKQYSVRLELQADCFAGVWAHSTQQRNLLEAGDVEEGLNARSGCRRRSSATDGGQVGESGLVHAWLLGTAVGVVQARIRCRSDRGLRYVRDGSGEMSDELEVRHNREAGRFESDVDGGVAFVAYTINGNDITFMHTKVPVESEGKGIAGKIVAIALAYAREAKLRVIPKCPYVASWLKRHPEYEDVVHPKYR